MTARCALLLFAVVFAAGAWLSPSVASADAAAADALFQEGRRLLEEGKTDAACLKLAESQAADPSSGTLLNLGLCHELQHKLAAAWSEYVSAAQLARDQGKEDRALVADTKAKEIAPRVPYLTVTVGASIAGLQIFRGAERLDPELLGRAMPVDPGSYRIHASAPGHRDWTSTVDVRESESKTVVVPELESETPLRTEPPKHLSARPWAPDQPPPSQPTPTNGSRPLGWIVGGAGVVALAVGAGFGLASLGSYKNANTLCPSHKNCSDEAFEARSSAETKAWIANVAFGVGVIGLGVGGWLVLSGRGDETTTRMGIRSGPGAAARVSFERSF